MYMHENEVPEALIEVLKKEYNVETEGITYLNPVEVEEAVIRDGFEDAVIAFIIEGPTDEDDIQLDICEIHESSIEVTVWHGNLFIEDKVITF